MMARTKKALEPGQLVEFWVGRNADRKKLFGRVEQINQATATAIVRLYTVREDGGWRSPTPLIGRSL